MHYSHRPAHSADLPDIVAVYNSTVASRMVTADVEPVSVASRIEWFHAHTPDKRPIWVVDEPAGSSGASRLAAWLSFSDFHSRPAYAGTAELSIYIHESRRQQGLGHYLLAQAIEAAPSLDVHTLVGLIFSHNVPSLRLFERAGFQRWARLPGVAELDNVRRDLIIVGRPLN